MRHRHRGMKRGRDGGGNFWLCYSDLMSALLLVFVLVMFYSVYQYLDMLEVKTAELMRQSGLLDQKQAELGEKDEALVEKDEALRSSEEKLNKSETELLAQQAMLLLSQQELESSQALLERQRGELEATRAQLTDQEAQLDEARALLALQQGKVTEQQGVLEQQQSLLSDQQTQMAQQQDKLDELIGVRSRIIASLAEALSNARVRATVDAQTGSITLDANVLFDVNKSDLKDEGKRVLDQFLPVYLNVLMDSAYASNVAEIIVEGHTDTDGTYMSNLKLSQDRALSVMEYILDDNYRLITNAMKLRLRKISTANGRSFSNPIYGSAGEVDKTASRRVEFKFRLQDEQMIDSMRKILEGMN